LTKNFAKLLALTKFSARAFSGISASSWSSVKGVGEAATFDDGVTAVETAGLGDAIGSDPPVHADRDTVAPPKRTATATNRDSRAMHETIPNMRHACYRKHRRCG
jgi:hypothetical protein